MPQQRRLLTRFLLLGLLCLSARAESQPATPKADFNANGVVDYEDFFAFAESFGARKGETRFDARFDLSGNGAVDFEDFFLFAADFGMKAGQTGGGGTQEITVYIADLLGDQVQVIRQKDNLVAGTIPVGQPRGLAFSPDGSLLCVVGVDSLQVFRVDGRQEFALALPTGFKVALSPDGRRAYVTLEGDPESGVKGGLGVVDMGTRKVAKLIPLPGRPSGIAVAPDGRRAYIANRTARLLVMDLVREVVQDSLLTTGAIPSRVILSPDGTRAYTNSGSSDTVNVVDTGVGGGVEGKERILRTFATGTGEATLISNIVDLGISADGKVVYASAFRVILAIVPGSPNPSPTPVGELLTIEVETGKAGRIPLGENAASLGISPDGKTAYVVFSRTVGDPLEVGIVDLQARTTAGSLPVDLQLPVEIKFRKAAP